MSILYKYGKVPYLSVKLLCCGGSNSPDPGEKSNNFDLLIIAHFLDFSQGAFLNNLHDLVSHFLANLKEYNHKISYINDNS